MQIKVSDLKARTTVGTWDISWVERGGSFTTIGYHSTDDGDYHERTMRSSNVVVFP